MRSVWLKSCGKLAVLQVPIFDGLPLGRSNLSSHNSADTKQLTKTIH